MKKRHTATFKDKKDWIDFTNQIGNVGTKAVDLLQENIQTNKVPKLDLHGYSLTESNKIVEGNPDIIKTVNDVWKFSKNMWSQDPTWYLVETSNK